MESNKDHTENLNDWKNFTPSVFTVYTKVKQLLEFIFYLNSFPIVWFQLLKWS
jgi:hypothetical protein